MTRRTAGYIVRNPGKFPIKISSLVLASSFLVTLSGCSGVRFNERETLSRADMQFDSVPLQSDLESHIYSSREGSSGAFASGGGGGCGCF